jgi:protein-S-isoprenylcysteine O-methyltransferase Ste14
MELFPKLEIGWLNGWILLGFEVLVQGSLLLVFPQDVRARLFDRSGWSVQQRTYFVLGKLFSLACLILIVLTPLKIESDVFIAGVILYALGLAGLVTAMLNFRDTQPDLPVTKGVYKISRHPQIVALFVIFSGICIAIGSWLALIALILSKVFQHFGILAEEEACLRKYGLSYQAYMRQIPRYFLFF